MCRMRLVVKRGTQQQKKSGLSATIRKQARRTCQWLLPEDTLFHSISLFCNLSSFRESMPKQMYRGQADNSRTAQPLASRFSSEWCPIFLQNGRFAIPHSKNLDTFLQVGDGSEKACILFCLRKELFSFVITIMPNWPFFLNVLDHARWFNFTITLRKRMTKEGASKAARLFGCLGV